MQREATSSQLQNRADLGSSTFFILSGIHLIVTPIFTSHNFSRTDIKPEETFYKDHLKRRHLRKFQKEGGYDARAICLDECEDAVCSASFSVPMSITANM
ncbi:hypothetical protein HPG69_006693 [Diceros bicornis minor]|uniref:Uncharacterized protein n=1 Tax=Diceros bicornis minor TaxID=77932 RepID=A0A7J7F640_DICBM|nr:hypothetical protein HPG69_006693 [Diceros bicornis minor]